MSAMRWILLGAVVLVAGAARAYDQRIHEFLSRGSYAGPALVDNGRDATAAAALRARLWRAGAEASPGVRARFLARYPQPERFDAWEIKRFLALNPDKPIAGLDDTPLPTGSDGVALYALASRLPDDDERNRDRLRHDDARRVVRDSFGRPLPEDPATLEMGSLTGLSSQAHAHYGLPHIQFSDDPEVLKRDPRRFAIPPSVHTFGADFAETYTALAVVASRLDGDDRLAILFAGAAAHHIEDVANQIHTVQVGLYDFFVDAKLESIKRELASVGGLLGARPTFVSIGIDIISNHHALSEALYAKHLLAPGDPVAALTRDAPPDAELTAALAGLPTACAPGFGRAITEALIERSSREGPEVYRAIRAVAARRYSRAGVHFGENDDPDAALVPGADLSRFYALETRGARRADQALAAWWTRFVLCRSAPASAVDAFAARLVEERLDALEAAESRARTWTPRAPETNALALWVPALYLVALALAAWTAGRLLRRRRR
jgi:hypothetical protein